MDIPIPVVVAVIALMLWRAAYYLRHRRSRPQLW